MINKQFQIKSDETSPGTFVLRLSGELDSKSAPSLMTRWKAERKKGRVIVINLAGIEFISSSGVGVLLAIVEESNESGAGIHLVAPSANVQSVMRLLGLERFLPILPSEDAVPLRKAG